MGLSSNILKDFANLTKQPSNSNQEYTAYGTIVEYTGAFYVKLDGSDQLTPMTTTANVKNGDRVLVSLKNHSATVIGNTTDPSASSMVVKEMDTRVSGLVADNVTINEKLAANQAVIDDLTAYDLVVKDSLEAHNASILELETGKLSADEADLKYATIVSLEAANAVIGTLESDLGDFKVLTAGQFVATEAIIKELQTEKLSAKDIEGKYANIDFSNISKATMESFYATSGLIENVSIGDATISGRLVGVVISGDLIEGGTVVAEKLVIQGTDGLYYKLNTDGMTTEAEQTEYNSLNGGILAKKSIAASKIDVKDLVAFDATIGGFVINDSSIHSGVKESLDNNTGGIYLDKDGQACFGDSTNFFKCYKDQNGDYKVLISADSILFGSDKKNIGTVINDIETLLEVASTKITANVTEIDALGTRMSTVEQTADGLTIRVANAESELDGLEIGGRNLLRHTGDLPITYNLNTGISSYGTVKPLTDTGEGVKFIVPEGGKGGINIPLVSDGAIQNGEEITISFDYRGNMTDLGAFYFLQRTSPNVSVNTFPDAIVSEEWQRYTYTFSSNYANDRTCYAVLLFYTGSTEAGKWIEIKKGSLKLERGNKGTDWTPAPEDVNSDISDAAKTATDFMKFSDIGLMIADMTGDELGSNVLIDSESVDIRSGDVVIASYGSTETYLGKGNKYSTIDMCDGSLVIDVENTDESVTGHWPDRTRITSLNPLDIYASGSIDLNTQHVFGNVSVGADMYICSSQGEENPEGMISFGSDYREKHWNDDGTYIGETYSSTRFYADRNGITMYASDAASQMSELNMTMYDITIETKDLVINGHKLQSHIYESGITPDGNWYYEKYNTGFIKLYSWFTTRYSNSYILGKYITYPIVLKEVWSAIATPRYGSNDATSLPWNVKVDPMPNGGYGCNIWVHDPNGKFTSGSTLQVSIAIIATFNQ